MEIKADPTRLMMSEVLRGNVPDLENEQLTGTEFVVTAEGWISFDGKESSTSLAGALHSVLFDIEPEIEFRVLLGRAFDVVEGKNLTFTGFTIQQHDRTIQLEGPFIVKAARISGIDSDTNPDTQMCILALSLKRAKKA